MKKKFVRIMWRSLLALIIVIFIFFIAIWNGWIGYMPDMEDLQNPIDRYASQVYSADGKVMGTYNKSRENRINVRYQQLSPYLVQALVATEDIRFYEHSGIDFTALGRAIIKRGFLGQESAGGGSTLTQQLAKQLYSEVAHSTFERLLQKPIEWVIAIKLERNFTKEEILTMYLNYFDFLHNAVGIKTASNTYYNKEPKNLTLDEAAMLIGLCKNPSYFNPVRYPERCKERRDVVLAQMEKAGYISQSEVNTYASKEIKLNFHRTDHKVGIANYLREYLRRYMTAKQPVRSDYPAWQYTQFHIDSIAWIRDPLYGWCNKNQKKDGSNYDIYQDGLKIYTTIDSRMQQYAEDAMTRYMKEYLQPHFDEEMHHKDNAPYSNHVTPEEAQALINKAIRQSERFRSMKQAGYSEEEINKSFKVPTEMTVFSYRGDIDTLMTPLDSIKYYKSFLRSGFVSMDANTGAVKAYVGGVDFSHFQYDMAAEGRRQVGSTMKPFLYSFAMENGYSPCETVPNSPTKYLVGGSWWVPRNSYARCGAMVTLKWGLAQSSNWVSAYLLDKLGPLQFVELLHQYGINNPEIQPSLALCLGPCDISVMEMVSGYTTFANRGIRCSPMYVTRIEDSEGNIITTFDPLLNEVISEESAYKMLVLLQGVVQSGTGSRLRYSYGINAEMGGKTGTTNRNSDAWFMAVTPNLVSGCWVGGEERDIHFNNGAIGQGAGSALPIYAYYIQKVYENELLPYRPDDKFDFPERYDACNDESTYSTIEDVFE